MTKFYLSAMFLIFMAMDARAAIVEKPLKLDEQPNVDSHTGAQTDANGAIVFPPATEPYKPVDRVTTPQPTYQSQPIQQPAYQPQPVVQQQPASSQPYNNPQPNYVVGFTSREMIERAASECEADLAELWRQKGRVDGSRRTQFQKSMGEAKVRCDKLKEACQAFKKADQELNTYQYNLQQAKNQLY